jgi:hypothetical protein
VLRSDPAHDGGHQAQHAGFVLYVEGPSDREILRSWAHRISPRLARSLGNSVVILGGRQPARAIEHFRGLAPGTRGVCVLDRDQEAARAEDLPVEPGLEFHTWRRRHIESYLLVPDAIRRCVRPSRASARLDRVFREHLPAEGDESAFIELDAKRLLGEWGPLARALGTALPPGGIARAMRATELHPDVHQLFARVREGLGLPELVTRVVARSPSS